MCRSCLKSTFAENASESIQCSVLVLLTRLAAGQQTGSGLSWFNCKVETACKS
jgi:hypothetical protein